MKTILAVDFNRAATDTYAINFPDTRVICDSVANVVDDLPYADIYTGGPPCPPFSVAGKRLLSDDPRDCIPDFVEAVGKARPRQFLMEQVPGFLSGDAFPYFCAVLRAFEAIGYVVDYRKLDAANYGVPQFRDRVWIWGMRKDVFDVIFNRDGNVQNDTGKDPRGGTDLRGGRIDSQGRDPLRRESAKHVEDATPAWREDAPQPSIREGKSLLSRWAIANRAKAPCQKVGQQSQEDRKIAAATLREVRIACGQIAGPSHRLRKAARRALVMRGLPPKGAWRKDVMQWPRPTHAWPWPVGVDLFGADLLPAVTVGWALNIPHRQADGVWFAASPAPTVQAKYKGGAEGLVQIAIPETLREPACTISAGSHSGGPEPINNRIREGYIRRLTPQECARLQSMPDSFVWPEKISKRNMYRCIGNGQASLMVWHLRRAMEAVDPDARSVIDLFCGGGVGAVGWAGKFWTYEPATAEVGAA